MDCQARDKWKLDFAFNASFTSLNVAKVTMKEMGMEYSMSSFKSLMTNIYLVKRIFKASGYTPNRTLISKICKHPTPMTIQLHPQCLLGIQGILRNWTFLIFKQV